MVKGCSLDCTKNIGSSQNGPVVKGFSLAYTKNIGLSQNGPVVKESSLTCTKNIGLSQNDAVVQGCTLACTCSHPYRSTPPPSLDTHIMLMHRPSQRMHFFVWVKLEKCTPCAETLSWITSYSLPLTAILFC